MIITHKLHTNKELFTQAITRYVLCRHERFQFKSHIENVAPIHLAAECECAQINKGQTWEALLKGMLSTVDLLVLTHLHQLLFIIKMSFTFLQNKLPL